MLKFKIDEIEYFVPDYISIENYTKIYKVKDLFNEEYFAAKLINIISNAPVNVLLESEYQEINFIANYIMNLIPTDKPVFYDRFELNGVQYGFFPNWKDLCFAEFVDMDSIATKKPEELLDYLHILAAIMYRPIIDEKSEHNFTIEEYNVELMKKRSIEFKKYLDIKYVLGAQFFFIKFAERFSNHSLEFLSYPMNLWSQLKLVWKITRMIHKIRLRKSMGGSLSLTELQKMILQNTTLYTRKN